MKNFRSVISKLKHSLGITETSTEEVEIPKIKKIGGITFNVIDLGVKYSLCGLSEVYQNNIDSAIDVVNSFKDYNGNFLTGCVRAILLAQTQSGKTAVTAVSANLLVDELIASGIPAGTIDVIYCSNISSNDLRKQNKLDFEATNLKQRGCTFNAIHLGNINKEVAKFNIPFLFDRSRVKVLYIDEAHYSNNDNGLFDKLMNCYINNFDVVYATYVSATPYSLLASNYIANCSKYPVVIYQPGKGYISLEYLFNNNQIRQTDDLVKSYTKAEANKGLGEVGQFYLTEFAKECIDLYLENFDKGLANQEIVGIDDRVGNWVGRLTGAKADAFEGLLESYLLTKGIFLNVDYDFEDTSPSKNGINNLPLVEIKPIRYRFFVVRGTARAGIRIKNKNSVSMWIESKNKTGSSVAQAGCGRFTGYVKHSCIIYADLETVRTIITFNDQVFNQQGSVNISSQDWFPSDNHLKSDVYLKHQYKTEFTLLGSEEEEYIRGTNYPKLSKEAKDALTLNDAGKLASLKTCYEADRRRKVSLGIPSAGSKRLYVASSEKSQRTFKDLLSFSESNFTVRDTYAISDRTPAVKSIETSFVLLDGPSANPKHSGGYFSMFTNLTNNNIPDTDGNLLDINQNYMITTSFAPDYIETNPVAPDQLSSNFSQVI